MTGVLLLLALVVAPPQVPAATAAPALEAEGRQGVVAADHVLASQIGVDVLKAGGDAVDAAVATALALGVVNPQSSGIGGGGFAVVWRAKERRAYALDFREVAPAAATPDTFTRKGLAPDASRFGGLAVAVPGEVAGLAELHRRWGTRKWAEVIAPAADLAERGFPCGEELSSVFDRMGSTLATAMHLDALLRREDGTLPRVGETVLLPRLARTLRAIEQGGPRAFYEGPIAEALVKAVRAAGGRLSADDLKAYKPKARKPLRGSFRGRTIYTMPPPSSGGVALLQVLGMLEALKDLPREATDGQRVGLTIEAVKHAFADRAHWLGDPAFTRVPLDDLLDGKALRAKAAALDHLRRLEPAAYGVIAPPPSDSGTSHLSVIDAAGNAVALTTTINTPFGSLVASGDTGVILNNQMDDFTTRPGQPNSFGLMQSERNAVAPGKRPLSSMTPTIVIEGSRQRPALVLGGSGGPRIITGTLQVLLNVLDHEQSPGPAVAAPRYHHQWLPDEVRIEPGAVAGGPEALEKVGHKVDVGPLHFGAVQAAALRKGGLRVGASDPRKHGQAAAY